MGGAAKIAAERKIFRSITSVRAASWEVMLRRISSRSARVVTELDISTAKKHKTTRVQCAECINV
jgi:hypothetical protein